MPYSIEYMWNFEFSSNCIIYIYIFDDRVPKILMYGQLEVGKHNVRRPWLRFEDKLRSNLRSLEIPVDSFENRAKD